MKSTPLYCTETQEILGLDHYTHFLPIKLLLKRCQQVGYNGNVNIDSDKNGKKGNRKKKDQEQGSK